MVPRLGSQGLPLPLGSMGYQPQLPRDRLCHTDVSQTVTRELTPLNPAISIGFPVVFRHTFLNHNPAFQRFALGLRLLKPFKVNMADSSAPAPAPPTEEVANLHLDEVTGERVSKTELKKRQKVRAKEADKAAKAASAPPKAASSKPKNSAGEEENLNPNQYFEIRSRQVNERAWCGRHLLCDAVLLLTLGFNATVLQSPETNPYPHKFQVTYEDDTTFHKDFEHLKPGETVEDKELNLAGRIYSIRASGSKLIFYGG